MAKFHINKHGIPAPCRAKTGNCPLGGDDSHFKSKEDAQAYIDKVNEEEYKLMPDVSKNNKNDDNSNEIKKLTPAQKKAKEKKEQEARLASKLGQYWKNRDGSPDESMVKFCLKNSKYVELGDSFVDVANKPRIHNEILYDDETKSPEVNFETFYNYNARLGMPKYYEKTGRNINGTGTLKMIPQYQGSKGFELAALTYEDPQYIKSDYIEVNEQQLEEINKGIKDARDDFDKRLKTYYKRYEDKIRTKGYWRDR